MPTDRPSSTAGALRHRVAAQRTQARVGPPPSAAPPSEPPRYVPLPGQLNLSFPSGEAPPVPTPDEPLEAMIPASALANRRLADAYLPIHQNRPLLRPAPRTCRTPLSLPPPAAP